MQLSEIWFLLIAVLFIGFLFLEGFDFGVGMSTKFLAKNDLEKRVLINSIGTGIGRKIEERTGC